jgi:hypothetical protein
MDHPLRVRSAVRVEHDRERTVARSVRQQQRRTQPPRPELQHAHADLDVRSLRDARELVDTTGGLDAEPRTVIVEVCDTPHDDVR